MRCKDVWFNNVLRQCREGNLQDEEYFFLHGLPTQTSPLSCKACAQDVVHDPVLGSYKCSWMNKYLAGETNMQRYIAEQERQCPTCQRERDRRNRLWDEKGFNLDDFCDAPALYSFNIPKYFTMMERAQHFAKSKHLQLTWCYARDKPVEEGDHWLAPPGERSTSAPHGLYRSRCKAVPRTCGKNMWLGRESEWNSLAAGKRTGA